MPETLTDRQAEELRFGIRELQKEISVAAELAEWRYNRLREERYADVNRLVIWLRERDEKIDELKSALETAVSAIHWKDQQHAAELAQLRASLY